MTSEVATLELKILKQVSGNVVGKTLVAFVNTSKALAHPCTLKAIKVLNDDTVLFIHIVTNSSKCLLNLC